MKILTLLTLSNCVLSTSYGIDAHPKTNFKLAIGLSHEAQPSLPEYCSHPVNNCLLLCCTENLNACYECSQTPDEEQTSDTTDSLGDGFDICKSGGVTYCNDGWENDKKECMEDDDGCLWEAGEAHDSCLDDAKKAECWRSQLPLSAVDSTLCNLENYKDALVKECYRLSCLKTELTEEQKLHEFNGCETFKKKYHSDHGHEAAKSFMSANHANLNDESFDVNNVGNTLSDPLKNGFANGFSIPGTIMAIIMISTGIVFVFFGHKLFKPILFIGGFYIFAVLSFVILTFIESKTGTLLFGESRAIGFLITAFVAGLLGGFLLVFLWRLGLAAIGALLGFTLAILILSMVSDGAISSGIGRTLFIAGFAIVFAILVFFMERPILILGTAIPGSYGFFFGVDVFAQTGFNLAMQTFLAGQGLYVTSPAVYGMIGGAIGLALIGIFVQFSTKGYDRRSRAPSGYQKA